MREEGKKGQGHQTNERSVGRSSSSSPTVAVAAATLLYLFVRVSLCVLYHERVERGGGAVGDLER